MKPKVKVAPGMKVGRGVPILFKVELVLRMWLLLEETREKQFRAPRSMLKLGEQCLDGLEKLRERQQTCRICGCTEARACPGGCHWVEPGLCSSCLYRAAAETELDTMSVHRAKRSRAGRSKR